MREDNHMSEFIRDKEGIGWGSEVKYPAAEQRGMTKLLFSKSAPRGGVLDPRAAAKCKGTFSSLQACSWLVAYARIKFWVAGIILMFVLTLALPGSSSAAASSKKLGDGKIATSNGKFSINAKKKTVTLKKSGTYQISGKIGAYQVVIGTSDLKVTIVLNNVTCNNTKTSCIYNSKKSTSLTIQSKKGSKNQFTGPAKFVLATGKSTPDAVIFSDGDLKFDGSGTITVKDLSSNGDAIGSKKTITMSSGTVNASSNAASIHADDIVVLGGTLIAASGDTAVKASQTVRIEGGNCQINAVDKGIQGKAGVVIKKGTINIRTSWKDGTRFEDFRGITAGVSGANGKKPVAGSIVIMGGSITIHSYGDCIHAANNVTITGGTFMLTSTKDDGIQAKLMLTISGNPKLTIQAEGKKVKGEIKNIASNIKY